MSIRNACFTLNNPTEEEFWEILKLREYNYLIVGYEIGEEGTHHYKGILNSHSLKDLIYSKRAYQEYHGEEDLKMHVQNKILITAQKMETFMKSVNRINRELGMI